LSKVHRFHINKLNDQTFEKASRDSNALSLVDALQEDANTDNRESRRAPLGALASKSTPGQRQSGYGKIQSSRTEPFFPNSKRKLDDENLDGLQKLRSQLHTEEDGDAGIKKYEQSIGTAEVGAE